MSRLIGIVPIVATMVLASCYSSLAEDQEAGSPEPRRRRANVQEIFDRLQPVDVCGKVVDQNGSPIVGADVMLRWEDAGFLMGKRKRPPHTAWLRSDENGLWDFTIDKPHRAFIAQAKKIGHECVALHSYGDAGGNLVQQKPTHDNPVVTVLRKKGDATFLIVVPSGNRIGNPLIRVFSPHSQTNGLNLLAEKRDKLAKGEYRDVEVAADYNDVTGEWDIKYTATNGTDGIIIANDLLYEAPGDGYQKEVVLSGPPWPRYLYLKSRTPAIYSRLDLEHSMWTESEAHQGFRISYKAWINPYGLRNLEYDSDLRTEWKLRKRLERDSKAELRAGKRPEKPDFKALIKAEKDKKK